MTHPCHAPSPPSTPTLARLTPRTGHPDDPARTVVDARIDALLAERAEADRPWRPSQVLAGER